MIRKPFGAQRESRAHVAVGRAIDVGSAAGKSAQQGARMLNSGCLMLFLLMMAFGLLTSATPWWFKLPGLALFGGAIYLVRRHSANIRRRT
jgi:hypothetical protein